MNSFRITELIQHIITDSLSPNKIFTGVYLITSNYLYRTVLRDYIETVYQEAQRELQRQQLDISLAELIDRIEAYINRQCTYLHFNLEHNAAQLITQ